MAQTKRSSTKQSLAGKRLAGAMREVQALEFARRIHEVREGLSLSQAEFARRFGLSLRSLQEWEQARRLPDMAVFAYLRVIERNPKAVQSALKTNAA
jgi:putative transcriptional regulator